MGSLSGWGGRFHLATRGAADCDGHISEQGLCVSNHSHTSLNGSIVWSNEEDDHRQRAPVLLARPQISQIAPAPVPVQGSCNLLLHAQYYFNVSF